MTGGVLSSIPGPSAEDIITLLENELERLRLDTPEGKESTKQLLFVVAYVCATRDQLRDTREVVSAARELEALHLEGLPPHLAQLWSPLDRLEKAVRKLSP